MSKSATMKRGATTSNRVPTRYAIPALVIALVLMAAGPASAAINLGTAGNYGVLAGSTVTNTGATTVNGDVGVSPGTAVTGFPPGVVVGGTIHSNDTAAMMAQTDLGLAYTAAMNTQCTADLSGQDLGGLVLTPGVYCFSSSAQLTGFLILDAQNNANAEFLFKIGSTLTTATSSSVLLINGASSCNLFWQVGSSATLGTGTNFAGNILAQTSITKVTGASLSGRALAITGAVTLDSGNITPCTVGGAQAPPGPPTTPTLSSWMLILLGAVMAAIALVKLRT